MALTLEEQDFSYKNADKKVNFYISTSVFKTILGTEKVEEKGIWGGQVKGCLFSNTFAQVWNANPAQPLNEIGMFWSIHSV